MVCASLVYGFWLGSWNLLSYLDLFFLSIWNYFSGEMGKYLAIIKTERLSFHVSDDFWNFISPNESTCQILDQNVLYFFATLVVVVVVVITVFTVFRLLTDFVCLYTYAFWLSLCKIVRSSVILLLPLITIYCFSQDQYSLCKLCNK